MLNRKLLEILQRFEPSEHRQLRLFLQSPYFNNSRQAGQLLALYDYIVLYDAEENNPSLQKVMVARKFFPDKPYLEKEKGPLDSLASQLFQLVRQFLNQQFFEREKSVAAEALPILQFYRKFGLEERFWQTVQTTRKIQEESKVKDARHFLDQFRIEEEVSNFQGITNTHEDDANVNAVSQQLDIFFCIVKLEYACAFSHLSRYSQISSTVSQTLTSAVLETAEQNEFSSIPLIRIYKKTLKMISGQPDEKDIIEFAEMLAENKSNIPDDKFRDLQALYRAFWARHSLKSGTQAYRQKFFEISQKHLDAGYFYIDNKIAPMSYRLLLNLGLKLHQFDWVKKLLDEHPPENICGTKYPKEVYSLYLAEYHFYKREYEESLKNLTYRPFENPNLSIVADVLLIKIYYETDDELLDSRMKALEQKVRRSKISKEMKEGHYNFLKKLDKIIKYGWQRDSPKRLKLIEEIRTQPNVFARDWLLEQLGVKAE